MQIQKPDAYERLVDRLLASPHYGERWARHWLDLVRYAETAGHEFDYDIVNAFGYRDYVIRAFNADISYDRFVTEQIAGDLARRTTTAPGTASTNRSSGPGFTSSVRVPIRPSKCVKNRCGASTIRST